ncbi:MAG: LysR family transcriptional regulator [Alphaproteobacteria bacterium]|nr:LysR family transcriptional regulator [Alphaproteobacteria bacterium]
MPIAHIGADWGMESRQLRYFCEIAESGSFTAAAARLRVAQPALSRQIAALEQDLGAPVFVRGPGGVSLTAHGEILLRHADAMRVHAARAREEISAALGHVSGWISFGTAPAVGRLLFGAVAARMSERYPGLRISFVEGVGAGLLNALTDGTLDLAVMSRPANAPGIEFHHLFDEPVYLVGARDAKMPRKAAGWDDLAGMPLVVTNQQTTMASWVEELSGQSQADLDLRYRVESSRAAIDIVGRGLAYGVLPKSTLHDGPEGVTLRKTRLSSVSLGRHLAWQRDHTAGPVFEAMKDVIVDEVARLFSD